MVDDRQTASGLGRATVELARQMPVWSVLEGLALKATHSNRLDSYRTHTDADAIAGVVSRWRAHKRLIEAMGQAFHFETAFVWQPVPVYRYDLTRHFLHDAGGNWFDYGERAKAGYPVMARLRPELEREGNFLWLADEQEGRQENLYVDGFHYSAAFSRDLSDRIARFVEPKINPAQTRSRTLSFSAGSCSSLRRKQLPTASTSISVPMKQRKASSGVHTIGSPRTLKLVLTSTGQPVRSLNAREQRVIARIGLAVHGLDRAPSSRRG